MATICPHNPFDPEHDVKCLRKAMRDFETDAPSIMAIICARNSSQRQRLILTYKQLLGRDLIKDLKNQLSGNFGNVIVSLMIPVYEYLAQQISKALSRVSIHESVIIEVFCTQTNAEINAVKGAYARLYCSSVVRDVAETLSDERRCVMVPLMHASRPEHMGVNAAKARRAAIELADTRVDSWGSKDSPLLPILCNNSYDQLRVIFSEYELVTGHDIKSAIRNEMSGELRDLLLAIVTTIRNTPLYFAERLKKAVKDIDYKSIVRIIVSRSEIDLACIREEYENIYKKPLEAVIKREVSGDFKRSLVSILRGQPIASS